MGLHVANGHGNDSDGAVEEASVGHVFCGR